MKPALKFLWITGLLTTLVFIRMYEATLFYDPFLLFFQKSYTNSTIPEFNSFKLIVSHIFRYGLNTIISLLILWVLFKKQQFIKVSGYLYLLLLLILLPVYVMLLHTFSESYLLIIFYIRRFLIQPLLIFILIPAFYYQLKFSD